MHFINQQIKSKKICTTNVNINSLSALILLYNSNYI